MIDKRIKLLFHEDLIYTAKYAEKYGIDALASTFDLTPLYPQEKLYRLCLKTGKRWQEVINKPPESYIL